MIGAAILKNCRATWASPCAPVPGLPAPRPDRGADEPAPPRQGHETAPVPGLPFGRLRRLDPAASLPHRQSRRTRACPSPCAPVPGLPAPRPDRGADEPAPPRQGRETAPVPGLPFGRLRRLDPCRVVASPAEPKNSGLRPARPFRACQPLDQIEELMNRHRHVRGTRLRPFRACSFGRLRRLDPCRVVASPAEPKNSGLRPARPFRACQPLDQIEELMNRHRHVRGTRLRPFRACPSGAFGGSTPAASLPHRQSRRTPGFALRARSGLASDFHRIERFKKREQLRGSASRIIRKTAERRQYVWKRRKLQTKARQARCRAIGHGQPSENPRITLPPCTQRSANLQAKVKSAVLVGKRAAPDDNTKRADHANHSGICLVMNTASLMADHPNPLAPLIHHRQPERGRHRASGLSPCFILSNRDRRRLRAAGRFAPIGRG